MQIFKRRALFGKQTVVHLTNIVGKRTVVLLNPSFKNFIYPLCVISNRLAASRLQAFGILISFNKKLEEEKNPLEIKKAEETKYTSSSEQ